MAITGPGTILTQGMGGSVNHLPIWGYHPETVGVGQPMMARSRQVPYTRPPGIGGLVLFLVLEILKQRSW